MKSGLVRQTTSFTDRHNSFSLNDLKVPARGLEPLTFGSVVAPSPNHAFTTLPQVLTYQGITLSPYFAYASTKCRFRSFVGGLVGGLFFDFESVSLPSRPFRLDPNRPSNPTLFPKIKSRNQTACRVAVPRMKNLLWTRPVSSKTISPSCPVTASGNAAVALGERAGQGAGKAANRNTTRSAQRWRCDPGAGRPGSRLAANAPWRASYARLPGAHPGGVGNELRVAGIRPAQCRPGR